MNIKEIKGSTLFVVDDNKENLKVLDQYLSDLELKVVPLRSGEEILKLIQTRVPDMILLDIMMPGGIDGYETCRRLKANETTKDIPVIFMSALTDTIDKVAGFNLGAVDYITKPIETEELLSRIHTHLSISRLQKELFEMNAQLEEKVLIRTEELKKTNLQLRKEIEERQQAEEEIRKLSTAVQQSPSVIAIIDLKGNLEYVNPKFTELTGYTSEEALGKNPRILKSGDQPDKLYKKLWKTISSGKEWHGEFHNKKKSGELYWEAASISPIFDKQGKITNYIKVAEDITEKKQAEERLKKTINATIETVSKTIEARDPYTSGHQHRVSQLATAIAKELNLSPDKIEGVRIASLIHDIGKISLPTEILSKPTKLTDIEFNLIKEHSQKGYNILKPIDFSYPIAQIVLQHHEKLNGSGYPKGLKGDKILLESKIIGVTDVVEAMSSHRPYRPALGIDKALEEISQNRGTLYDPEVVDACLKLFKEKRFKF